MVLEILEACQSLGHDPSFKCKIVVLLDNQVAIKVSGHILGDIFQGGESSRFGRNIHPLLDPGCSDIEWNEQTTGLARQGPALGTIRVLLANVKGGINSHYFVAASDGECSSLALSQGESIPVCHENGTPQAPRCGY